MKLLIIIPTYNEREHIDELVSLIYKILADINPEILVVDGASPDGTANAVMALKKSFPYLHLLLQPGKNGLGAAYLDGMRWAFQHDYDCIITMDADFSHHPRYLKKMISYLPTYDLVIGSRYVKGGQLENWPLKRRLLSRFANRYARTLTGLPFRDLTSGFHCFNIALLKKILNHPIQTEGYAFLVELKNSAYIHKAKFVETPIVFSDRTKGRSKISRHIIFESVVYVLMLFFKRLFRVLR